MTAISLVASAQRGAAQPPPGSDKTHSIASFAELLAKAGARHEQEHRAYSFAELGMFGLHRAQFTAELREEELISAKALLPSPSREQMRDPTGIDPQVWIAVETPTPSRVAVQVEAKQPPNVSPQSRSVSLLGATVSSVQSATTNSARNLESTPSSESQTAGAGAAPNISRSLLERHPVHVVVTGANNALQVAIRSDTSAAPTATKLRRLVEATVTQFEMHIAELHINGARSFASQPVFSLGGGFNGGRAR
jgi:hypothetical protein